MSTQGLVPRTPSDIRTQLTNNVAATNPGYTNNLPGSLIEDISSTDVAAIALCEQARIELVNSITPYGANEFLLTQLGNVYGVTLGEPTNGSVYVTFTGQAGFVIPQGFIVSDGTNQYKAADGGIIGSGLTASLYCIATNSNSFSIPAGTVTQIITSVPSPFTLSCTNPLAGNPATTKESPDSYRVRVLQAGIAASQGMARYLKTLLPQVPGVVSRLIAVRQGAGTWKVICGGGDPYQVAYAIYQALFDITDLAGSATPARNVTVTINDYPDVYQVIFVNPPKQDVGIVLTWNTTATNAISDSSIAQLVSPQLEAYINSLPVGYTINIFDMQDIFLTAVNAVIPSQYISKLNFAVTINGVPTSPSAGTQLIYGDAESYFQTISTAISIVRG